MQECQKCFKFQPTEEFVTDKRRKGGLYPYCKTCSKDYYQKNRQRLLDQKKEYADRPEIKARNKIYKKQYYLENKDYHLQIRRDYYADVENRKKLLLWKSK